MPLFGETKLSQNNGQFYPVHRRITNGPDAEQLFWALKNELATTAFVIEDLGLVEKVSIVSITADNYHDNHRHDNWRIMGEFHQNDAISRFKAEYNTSTNHGVAGFETLTIMREMLALFSGFVQAIRKDHEAKNVLLGGNGHGFDHAFAVAKNCLEIAEGHKATLAWVAAMCHNTDRHFGDEAVEPKMKEYLSLTDFNQREKDTITRAVLNHSKRPSANDDETTIILMDADKLANIDLTVVLRCGQFHPELPILDLLHPGIFIRPPGTNYRNPGSLVWDLKGCLEWEESGWFRIKKAIELAKPKFALLRAFLDNLLEQMKDVGFMEYPFVDDFGPPRNQ